MCEGTLIKTSRGLMNIEDIEPHEDFCLSYLDSGFRIHTEIKEISIEYKNFVCLIHTYKNAFICDLDQLLFDGSKNKYIPAKYISKGSILIDENLDTHPCTGNIIVKFSAPIYRVILAFSHNFFITEHKFLAHDSFPLPEENDINKLNICS